MIRNLLYIGMMLAGMSGIVRTGQAESQQQTREPSVIYRDGPVIGKMIDAGFLYGETNYHAIQQASDGNVYYAIGSQRPNSNACMFRYDPRTGKADTIGNVNDILGEDRTKVFSQSKIHCDLYEKDGKLYFGTQGGVYQGGNLGPYPGGHFMSYDLKMGAFHDYGIGEPGEGMVTMSMDTARGRMYTVTWPGLKFICYDISTGTIRSFGKSVATPDITDSLSAPGPRSLGVDPRDGNVYWHNMDDTIACYDYTKNTVSTIEKPRFDLPILQVRKPGLDRVYWRSIRWSDAYQRFYGVDTHTEYLFSFEPHSGELEIIDRIASAPVRKSGGRAGASMAFELSRDGKTVYYIAGAPAVMPGTKIRTSELHLVTYEISLRRYVDHGPIELDDGRKPNYCQGLDVGTDGNLYIVCTIPFTDLGSEKGKRLVAIHHTGTPPEKLKYSVSETNLVVMKNPLAEKK
ncbi:hypothetical protein LLG96_05005 [bacterium]|nr:hypothetical protein [bacterium]